MATFMKHLITWPMLAFCVYSSIDIVRDASSFGSGVFGVVVLLLFTLWLLGAVFWVIDVTMALGNAFDAFMRRFGD